MATKRKADPLETEVKVLRAADSGRRKKDIPVDFELAPSTTSTILSARKKIKDCYANNTIKTDRKS
ncbi:hypothetical protein HPB47_014493 [Ixodes persulcatus]|uniref:Uncharacterized protein n=1 Tax=Ixodes persulcatus TaxID=34615 RepID=A0AC60QX89_IXOPE|nr:hypothetical protein HPB47_014493 [Ixodes persulcatus]